MHDSTLVDTEKGIAYDIIAMSIFALMSYTFLFPLNKFIPLDRRTVAAAGATLCYVTRNFLFSHENKIDVIAAIDFDVLILLAAIMAINHVRTY